VQSVHLWEDLPLHRYFDREAEIFHVQKLM